MIPSPGAGVGARLSRAAVFAAVCAVLSATGHALASCVPVPWWAVAAGFLVMFGIVAPLAGRPRSTAAVAGLLALGQLGLHSLFGLAQQTPAAPADSGDVLVRTAAKLVCGAGPNALSHADAQRILVDAGIHPADLLAAQGDAGMAGMQGMQGMAGMPGMPGMPDMGSGTAGGAAMAGLLPSASMLVGHLLAALVTGWLLRHGDLALRRIGEIAARGAGGMTETLTDATRLRSLRAAFALVPLLLAGLSGMLVPEPWTARPPRDIPQSTADEALQHTVIRRGPPAAYALAA